MPVIKRALISVSDKQGVVEFALALQKFGVEILSTGGTAKLFRENNIPVVEVSDYTGFPEMLDGRVKTLHPKVHGGILGRRDLAEHVSAMQQAGIPNIDMVVVNLYPFRATIANPNCTLEDAIENIDIGGPTMVRAAAKNYHHVAIVTDPADYAVVLREMQSSQGAVGAETRFELAKKAFSHTAEYDGAISNYLTSLTTGQDKQRFPNKFNVQLSKVMDLRYGENPHQAAAFYTDGSRREGVATARQWQGKELSYNNINDTDAAFELVAEFAGDAPACAIIKHANPCGVATGATLAEAYARAYDCDRTSAFGGIIALNQPLDAATAERYGRTKKSKQRDRRLGIIVAAVALVGFLIWGISTTAINANKVTAEVHGFEVLGDQQTRVEFVVSRPTKQPVVCQVEILDASYAVVGYREVTVLSNASDQQTTLVNTTSRGVTGVVKECWVK